MSEQWGPPLAYPNSTWDNLHAEMNIMQSAIRSGVVKKSGTMEIVVAGKREVCRDCRVQLPVVAEEFGLRFMTVVDKKAGVVYYWRQGLSELEPLGDLSAAQPGK